MNRSERAGLTGYQDWIMVDGRRVKTLAELWPESPRAMVIGLNPAPRSVEAGHYYQGAYGQRQMRRLAQAGLFDLDHSCSFVDDVAMMSDVGFADLVRRPTQGEVGVKEPEIEAGAERIKAELVDRHVPLVISVFRHPARYLTGLPKKRLTSGFLEVPRLPHTKLFRMPGPTAAKAGANHAMAQLRAYLEVREREK